MGERFLLLHTDHRKSWSRKASEGRQRPIINPGREPLELVTDEAFLRSCSFLNLLILRREVSFMLCRLSNETRLVFNPLLFRVNWLLARVIAP